MTQQLSGRRRWWQVYQFWQEHGRFLFFYTLLSLALTWPMVQSFASQIPGTSNDAHNGLWVMWHVKEAVAGREPLFGLPLLYYPVGATLLTHIPGPLVGFLALPFWPWGPEAAHNGAVLLSFVLTGYTMYLLGRTLGFSRPVAFFSGVMLLVAPMHLLGLWGHTTKVFLGATPLVLLGLHRLLAPRLNGRQVVVWAVATAVALLLTLLHDSFQFIFTLAAAAFFLLAAFITTERSQRGGLGQRTAVLAVSIAIIVGPLLLATIRAAYDPTIDLDRNFDSYTYQPDLAEFFLPPANSVLPGRFTRAVLAHFGLRQTIETAVSLSWVGLILGGLVLWRGDRRARLWLLFTFGFVVLALGPVLKVLGHTSFTEYDLPIVLPYAFLTGLPGLDFLRTPGRFMQIGFVGLAAVAGFGLTWLNGRFPSRARVITAVAVLLLLLENWPQPWPRLSLRPLPDFYRQIAEDEARYGVLDIPFTAAADFPAIVYGTHYQMYQMRHRKGIAMGYISRTYDIHPIFPCFVPALDRTTIVQVNGEPARCYLNALYDLAENDYRYVVWHKPQPEYDDYQPGSWGETAAVTFLDLIFGEQPPLVDDDLVRVYGVPPAAEPGLLTTSIVLKQGWYRADVDGASSWNWAQSPATLWVYSPRAQLATLQITPFLVYEPELAGHLGRQGTLEVSVAGASPIILPIQSDETADIPLQLKPGINPVTLALEAGNFRPADEAGDDRRWLSFAVRTINLQTDD